MKFLVEILSKDDTTMMDPVDHFPNSHDHTFHVNLDINNAKPIGQMYNEFIEHHKDDDFDYIVLMHSDVKFDAIGLADHIASVHGKYDVIGLCGCSKISVGQSPFNWFCGSRPYPEFRWGCVTHGEINNQTSYFSQHSPLISDHEVACIDGLCIILSKHAIDVGLRFDPSVGDFDLYDTDISFQAMMTYKLKIGVIIRKDLTHYSLGKSILSNKFLINEYKFRQKWKLPITNACRNAYDSCSSI